MRSDLNATKIALLTPFFLVACSEAPESSLQEWMSEQRSSLKPVSEAVAVPKKFNPQVYAQEGKGRSFWCSKIGSWFAFGFQAILCQTPA
jgi:Tfp pilus assembly protein PilP